MDPPGARAEEVQQSRGTKLGGYEAPVGQRNSVKSARSGTKKRSQDFVVDHSGLNVDDGEATKLALKGENLLKAIRTQDSSMLKQLIFEKPNDDFDDSSQTKDCFFSHRGPDLKKLLIEPLQRTLKTLYQIDCFVDSLPLTSYKMDHKARIVQLALWCCPTMVIFLSPNFHKSDWCLKELYTAIFRAKVDTSFTYHIVYCQGMEPCHCNAMREYRGLNLGHAWGTLHTWTLSFSDLVARHLHEGIVRLVKGESSLKLLDDELVELEFKKQCKVCEPTLMHGVPPLLSYFEGRQDELRKLSEKLHVHQSAMIVPIGLGGVGKSQLVVQWTHLHRLEYEFVVWIRAEFDYTLHDDLACLASCLGVACGAEDSKEENAKRVISALETRPSNSSKVLLIYDNAESFEHVVNWLPRTSSSAGCDVIVTTRNRKGCTETRTVTVGPLDLESSVKVIEHLIGRELTYADRKAIVPVLESFGYLPLAIVSFAQLIKVAGAVGNAIELLNEETKYALSSDHELDQDYGGEGRESVWAVCHLQISRLSSDSCRVVECMSFLAADNCPRGVLSDCVEGRIAFNNALKELMGKSVVTSTCDGSLSIHRLLQLTARESLAEESLGNILESVGNSLVEKAKVLTDNWVGRRRQQDGDIVPHLETFIMHLRDARDDTTKSKFLSDALLYLGRIQEHEGQYEQAQASFGESLRIDQATYGNEHPSVAVTLNNIGDVYKRQGHYDRALEKYRESLRIDQATYGNEHPSVAVTLNNIGEVYERQGHYDRALENYRESLRIKQATYSNEHPGVSVTLNNIGDVYKRQGHYDRALENYRESLRIKQATYGNEHPSVSVTLNNIGDVYILQGQYDRALENYRESLRIDQATYGHEHPHVAVTLNNIGDVYKRQGHYDRALEKYHESLRIKQATYGNEHPEVAATLHNIGEVYERQGHYDRALEKYHESLRIKQATYGNEHPEVAATLNNIGYVYQCQGHYDRAVEKYRESLRIQQATYGNEHPGVAAILNNIGDVYKRQGHYDRALENYRESLRIDQATYGHEHPHVAVTLNNIGEVYEHQGHYDRALENYRESLRIKQATYGNEHPSVAVTLNNIGEVYEHQGHYDRALENYRESLRIKQATYGNEHPSVAVTLNNIGDVYKRQGHYDRALEKYRESLRIKQASYGSEHPGVAVTLSNLGDVFYKQGLFHESLNMMREALRIHRLFFKSEHPDQQFFVDELTRVEAKVAEMH